MKKILTITILLLGVLSLFSSCKKDDSSKPLYQNKWVMTVSDDEEEITYYLELGKDGKGTYGLVVDELLVKEFKAYAERPEATLTDAQKEIINNLKANDVASCEITYTFTYEEDGKTGTLIMTVPFSVDEEGNPESETFKCSTESKDLMLFYDKEGNAVTLRSVSSSKMSIGKCYPELGSLLFGA